MQVPRHGLRVVQVLDVGATVTRNYAELKEVALFLTTPNVLPPGQALGLYISVSGEWQVNLDVVGLRVRTCPGPRSACVIMYTD